MPKLLMNRNIIPCCMLALFLIPGKSWSQALAFHCNGYYLQFNGVNGYVDAEDAYTDPTGLTLAAWVCPKVKNAANMGLLYRQFYVDQGSPTTVEYGLVINSQGQFMFQAMIDTTRGGLADYSTPGQLDSLSSGIAADSGQFYHVAATLDPKSYLCNFYVNGVVVASKMMKGPLHWANDGQGNFYDASIGAKSATYAQGYYTWAYFNGDIDDAFEADFALNADQIDTIAAGNNIAEIPFMYYLFTEGSGSYTSSLPNIQFNTVGYGNTGYLTGGVTWEQCSSPQPVSVAGANQSITLPDDSVTLNGSASYEAGSGGSIKTYIWSQISGPARATITSPYFSITPVKGLSVPGTYTFTLIVIDSVGAVDSSHINIAVSVGALVANAGPDQTISQPLDSVTLDGSKSAEPGGTIQSYTWSQLSGPASAGIRSPGSAVTVADGLQGGVYVFQLLVTDAFGNSATATVTITVGSCPSQPTITENDDDQLESSAVSGNQWLRNGSAIPGATGQTYDPGDIPGKYTVQVTQNGCSSVVSDPVCVYPDVPEIDGDLTSCFSQKEYTVDKQDSVSFAWSLSGGGTMKNSSDTSITVNWAEYGDYTITVVASAGGCADVPVTATVIISTPSSPVMTMLNDSTFVSSDPDSNQWYLNGVAMPDETDDTLYLESDPDPGRYTVKSVDGTCYSPPSNSICINPDTPEIESSSGKETVCLGYQKYEITNSQDSVSYLWSLGDIGDSIVSYDTDTAATISWKDFAGGRTINIIPSIDGCVGPTGDLVITVISPPAAPSIYFDTADDELKLVTPVDEDDTVQWLWKNMPIGNATEDEYKPRIPDSCGLYQAQLKEDGCQSPVSNSVCVGPPKPGAISGDSAVCAAQAIYHIDSVTFITYKWTVTGGDITGSDSLGQVSVNWTLPGEDTLIVGDAAGGCPGDTSKLVVLVGTGPAQPVIKYFNGELGSNSVSGNQWYLNGTPISGATGYGLTPADTGYYTVQVTSNGCTSPMSDPYHIGLNNIASPTIDVFPNPSSSLVVVTNQSSYPYTIQLFDMNGTNLKQVTHASGTQQLSTAGLASGTYTILVTDEVTKKQTTKKILKL
jgi:hypothetical protein